MKLIVVMAISFLAFTGCSDDKKSSEELSVQEEIIGTWKTNTCFVSEFGSNNIKYLEITDIGIKEITRIYEDESCLEFKYESVTGFQEYEIGEKIISASGLEVYEIDWVAWAGDASVTIYQIITVIDEQLYLGIPIYWGGNRASELNFHIPYTKYNDENS
ncbi:MAG: hypothetical protein HRU20_18625 [Pseudomonadales bacterium]|nr:hypothetical protein [Pseudomonadales bacterium]NRB40453.1 hypothetical protein [Pseudomonadales bacterium]